MRAVHCSRCPRLLNDGEEICPNCGTHAYCLWDTAWYRNRFTRLSIGGSEIGRNVGKSFALCSLIFIVISLLFAGAGNLSDSEKSKFIVGTLSLLFFTYEIWAYLNGRRTMITRVLLQGVPKHTYWRTIGFAIDCVLYIVVVFATWRVIL
jgi:hypothetical protein